MVLHYPPLPIYKLLYLGALTVGLERSHLLLTIFVFAACYMIHWYIMEKVRAHFA